MKPTRLVLRKATLVFILLGAALAGFCVGFQTNAAIIRARVRALSGPAENMPAVLTDNLTKMLNLDAAQQDAVRAIMERHDARMREARERRRAEVDAMVAELDAELQAEFTPEQKALHEKYLEELRRKGQENRNLRRAVGGAK
jgi:hypothetical protein